MPAKVRLFVWLVVAAAVGTLLVSPWHQVDWSAFVALATFHVLYARLVPARTRNDIGMLMVFAIVLAAVIMLPVGAAGLATAIGIAAGRGPRGQNRHTKRLYNSAQTFLATAAGVVVYHVLGGTMTLRANDFPQVLLPILVASVTTWVANDLLVAAVLEFSATGRFLASCHSMLRDSWPMRFGYGMLGILIAVLWNGTYGALAVVLAPVPVCVAGWAYMQYTAEQRAYDDTTRSLVQALEIKDYYTKGHSERVGRASAMIAEQLRLKERQVEMVRYAGLLHDIGKLSVPTQLLGKAGPLTPDERAAIQQHPVRGVDMVREIDFLDEAYNGIMHHHERFDGRGYPAGLAADRIPVFARIIAVADAFDCMTSTRSYRRARSVDESVAELWHCAGTQFDPTMVRALVAALAAAEERGKPWQPSVEAAAPPDSDVPVAGYDDDDPRFARLLFGTDMFADDLDDGIASDDGPGTAMTDPAAADVSESGAP